MSITGIPKMRNDLQYDRCTANLRTCFKDSVQKSIVIVIVESYCRQSPLIVSTYNRVIELDNNIFLF